MPRARNRVASEVEKVETTRVKEAKEELKKEASSKPEKPVLTSARKRTSK